MLSSTHNNVQREKMSLETMLQQNVDGLIIEPTKSSYLNPNLNYYLQIVQNKIPLLMLHAKYEELDVPVIAMDEDRKSTRLNSSHVAISYAVFCLKKKINNACAGEQISLHLQVSTEPQTHARILTHSSNNM